jgi:multidrug resistance efflux pump
MTRQPALVRQLIALVTLATVTLTTVTFSGCSVGTTDITATGTVDDQIQTVSMPTLSTPAVNLDAGFTTDSSQSHTDESSTASTYSLGSTQQVVQIKVSQGQSVHVGQVIAVIDSAALAAQVAATKADAAVAASQVDLLTTAIADTYTKGANVTDAKTQVRAAIKKLTKAQATLKRNKAALTTARTELATKLTQAQTLLANYPPTPTPALPSKAQLQASVAALQTAITKVDAGLTKIAAAEHTLTTGLAKARSGLAQLNTAATKISDARAQLRRLRTLANISANIAKIPILIAQVQLNLTSITAPASGVVINIAAVGDRLAAGATVAQIRATAPTKVTAWLAPSQAAKVCLGGSATITGDWMTVGHSVGATITHIAPTAEYPPSSVATDQTHLTRAVQVTFTSSSPLPPGVGVDISITACQSQELTGAETSSSPHTTQSAQTGESHG